VTTPKLLIRKGLVQIQGRTRPSIQALAIVDERLAALLLEHFANDSLFKRTMYINGFGDGHGAPSRPLQPMMSGFLKNDACPEITVKTLLAGQTFQGNSLWDLGCFEYIARRAFDALVEMLAIARELGRETSYGGADLTAFEADTAREVRRPGTACLTAAA
jgi:hypothetical protein